MTRFIRRLLKLLLLVLYTPTLGSTIAIEFIQRLVWDTMLIFQGNYSA